MKFGLAAAALALTPAALPAGAADSITVGFIDTFSARQALSDEHQRNGFERAIDGFGGVLSVGFGAAVLSAGLLVANGEDSYYKDCTMRR